MTRVKLSVVLPTYNGEKHISQALDSILNQTFRDFELIVINDGSTDKTANILKKYSKDDARIRIISQTNKGLVASLNKGIEMAQGQYIARHDDDDASLPDRFERQVAFLDSHPDVVVVGSSMSVMNDAGTVLHNHAVLLNDPELRHELLVRSPFPHGSVMYRKSAVVAAGLYRAETWPAEDYDLWLRLSAEGKLANIDDCLYVYRENSHGISLTRQQEQAERTTYVRGLAWDQRRKLLSVPSFNLSSYLKLDMGGLRIKRVLDNCRQVQHKAWQTKDRWVLKKNLLLVISSRQAYRHMAGTIKRKFRRK